MSDLTDTTSNKTNAVLNTINKCSTLQPFLELEVISLQAEFNQDMAKERIESMIRNKLDASLPVASDDYINYLISASFSRDFITNYSCRLWELSSQMDKVLFYNSASNRVIKNHYQNNNQ